MKILIILVIFIYVCCSTVCWIYIQGGVNQRGRGYKASEFLDQLLSTYDHRLRPDFQGSALTVDVNLNVRSMGPISEIDMAYQMDCYFRQSWVDRRLEFNSSLSVLQVSINVLDRLWKPDTHFFNGQHSYLHTVTSPNKLLRINHSGRILYSMRLTIKASCPMHLERFPLDTQTCSLQFGSHGYNDRELQYIWTHGDMSSIQMSQDMTLSQFDLVGFPHGNTSKTQPHRGRYSVLWADFRLTRHKGYFVINVYIPCSLLVLISWVGFWINREATADRIALGVTTVLTMAFISIDNRRDMPKVSYYTALDYYLGTCFVFVLASIIQFAGVHRFTKLGSGEPLPSMGAGLASGARLGAGLGAGAARGAGSAGGEGPGAEPDNETDRKGYKEWDRDRVSVSVVPIRQCNHRARGSLGRISIVSPLTTNPQSANNDADQSQTFSSATETHNGERRQSFWARHLFHWDQRSTLRNTNSVSELDRTARVLFPILFLIFNVLYWIWYLH